MKTIFTLLIVLLFNSVTVYARQINPKAGIRFYLLQKKGLSVNDNQYQPKKHLLSNSFLSVPGYSHDYSWDMELSNWIHDSNSTYTYNNAGKLIEEIVQEAGTDIYTSRISYSYDISGNITEEVSYIWGDNEWIPVSGDKSVYMINEDSQFSGIIEQTLDNGIWVNKTKIVYVLNSYNIPIGILTYNWENNDWMLYSKTMNIIWADWPTRKLAAYTLQYWQNQNWFNGERFISQYDGTNYTATTEIWDNVQWVNSTRETYSRSENKEISILEYWTDSGWENADKYMGTTDNEGNPTGFQYSTWNKSEWTIVMDLIFDLEYNETKDVTEMIFRYWDPGLTSPVNISKYEFSNFLHFTTDFTDVNNTADVKVYPNPVSNNFNIQVKEPSSDFSVQITNLSGQIIFTNSFSSPMVSINTAHLNSGMYMLTVKTDNGKIFNSKLLKN